MVRHDLAVDVAAILAASLLTCCSAPARLDVPFAAPDRAWMVLDAKTQNLLYISDLGTNAVDVFTYPKGTPAGKLTGFGSVSTLCSDKAGDVFVVDEAGPVDVYAHGGATPIRRLPAAGAPDGCSVDPTTGNLAVTNQSSYVYGTIAIYPKAKGKPKTYFNEMVDATFFCGYDDKGNLFIDGWNRSAFPIFVELPRGKRSFDVMTLDRNVKTPGGVMWDGKYVAVGDKGGGVIYRADATGKVAQTVKLKGGGEVEQFWILGSTLIGPNAQANGAVGFWRYPAGGSPSNALKGFTYPIGATVSLAR